MQANPSPDTIEIRDEARAIVIEQLEFVGGMAKFGSLFELADIELACRCAQALADDDAAIRFVVGAYYDEFSADAHDEGQTAEGRARLEQKAERARRVLEALDAAD